MSAVGAPAKNHAKVEYVPIASPQQTVNTLTIFALSVLTCLGVAFLGYGLATGQMSTLTAYSVMVATAGISILAFALFKVRQAKTKPEVIPQIEVERQPTVEGPIQLNVAASHVPVCLENTEVRITAETTFVCHDEDPPIRLNAPPTALNNIAPFMTLCSELPTADTQVITNLQLPKTPSPLLGALLLAQAANLDLKNVLFSIQLNNKLMISHIPPGDLSEHVWDQNRIQRHYKQILSSLEQTNPMPLTIWLSSNHFWTYVRLFALALRTAKAADLEGKDIRISLEDQPVENKERISSEIYNIIQTTNRYAKNEEPQALNAIFHCQMSSVPSV